MSGIVEFDLGGVVGIRLVGASPSDARAVERQLGPIRSTLAREPDLVLRFVERLDLRSPLRYLGRDDAAFADDAFLVLRGKQKSRARVRIPLERVGGRCEIVCESGLAAVPLLVPILNLTALARGYLPLHAAAFVWEGTGVVATGWSKGGKTETLLAFCSQGARYVGDEWVYLAPEGDRMFGIPEPVRLWGWHLDSLPQFRARIGARARARLLSLSWVDRALARVTRNGARHRTAVARTLNRLAPLVRGQLHVDVPPGRLFAANGSAPARPDVFLFVATHESPDVVVRPIDPGGIARRMVHSLQEEQEPLSSCYRRFRFAFPETRNELLERSREMQEGALARVLQGKPAFELLHPYPVSLPRLFEAARPRCEGR
ncbi:MAG TPA: hypothetical protein VFI25_07215 [Planctomycetota bacterium]|nr:hypothetical protein [Planctomycetota bacterium]